MCACACLVGVCLFACLFVCSFLSLRACMFVRVHVCVRESVQVNDKQMVDRQLPWINHSSFIVRRLDAK